jgi:type II secretory pathway pseudopilin PulG
MSHRAGPYHNIWTRGCAGLNTGSSASKASIRRTEHGYTLVALLALMTVIALFAVAAAPAIRQQALREREAETIFRGEQVADAIRAYYANQQRRVGNGDAALPTSIDKLLEGLPSGTKNVQILRPSAARDPLSESGEWRLVRPRSLELSDFVQALMLYSENVRPQTNDPQLKQVEQHMAPPVLPTLGIASSSSDSSIGDNSTGPFIGVASESSSDSVLHYYGIARHRDWIFTPLFR